MRPDPAPVTVIVPCFNEADGIPTLLARLDTMHEEEVSDWCFLFVDDGSSDDTFSLLVAASRTRPWVDVVRHPENLGLGEAIRTGFQATRSPIICTMDSDCTYPPERLKELAEGVERGADIVTASAWHPSTGASTGNPVRLYLSRAVSHLYKMLLGQDVYTFTCLFRAYRREQVADCRFITGGFGAVAEIMLRAIVAGADVREVPMRLEQRIYGESKLKVTDAMATHVVLISLTTFLVASGRVRRMLAPRFGWAAPQHRRGV